MRERRGCLVSEVRYLHYRYVIDESAIRLINSRAGSSVSRPQRLGMQHDKAQLGQEIIEITTLPSSRDLHSPPRPRL